MIKYFKQFRNLIADIQYFSTSEAAVLHDYRRNNQPTDVITNQSIQRVNNLNLSNVLTLTILKRRE